MDAPPLMDVGTVGEAKVRATLIDGGVAILDPRACGVEYFVSSDSGVLEVDDVGRLVARKTGAGTLHIKYEEHFAQARVQVQ